MMSATQYCLDNTWRTVQSLPPSIAFLEKLASPDADMQLSSMLHSLILAPRLNNRLFGAWIKDALVKQGLKTSQAEALIKSADSEANSFSSNVKAMQKLVTKLDRKFLTVSEPTSVLSPEEMPTAFELAILDAFIAKLQISVDTMFSAGGSDFLTAMAPGIRFPEI